METDNYSLAQKLGMRLQHRNVVVTTAESCTGGGLGQAITAIPGSSQWYHIGYITYGDWAKREQLGVTQESLSDFGAVSEVVACEMAEGALAASKSHLSVAITGIAGPDGGSAEKPVGTVWLAWAGKGIETISQCRHFEGSRDLVREQAITCALEGLINLVE